jgi:hypothetical protein
MFKLWDSYPDLQTLHRQLSRHKLYWGVARAVPKEDPVALRLNYQFIQTLNLTAADVEELCSQFVDWLQGVSYESQWYMMLFLLGVKNTPDRIAEFLRSGDNYWAEIVWWRILRSSTTSSSARRFENCEAADSQRLSWENLR